MDTTEPAAQVGEHRNAVSHYKKDKRNTNIDLLRLVAAFGVINIHVPFTEDAARTNAFFWPLCVPFFFLTSLMYFLEGLTATTDLKETLKRSWKRLLLPYLAWTIIYVCLMLIKHTIAHQPNEMVWYKVLFYGESAVQLYFIPELFFAQMLLLGLFFMFNKAANKMFTGVLVVLVAIAFYVAGTALNCFGVLPAHTLVFYIVAACVSVSVLHIKKAAWVWALVGVTILLLPGYITRIPGHPPILDALNYLPTAGLGLVLVAITLPQIPLSAFVTRFTRTSFGIYLCHVIFLEGFEFFAGRYLAGEIKFNFIANLAVTLLIFLLSAAFTVLLSKIPLLRRLFLGLTPKKYHRHRRRRQSASPEKEGA